MVMAGKKARCGMLGLMEIGVLACLSLLSYVTNSCLFVWRQGLM